MSKLMEKVNPDIEFASDKMLRDLHKIRIKLYDGTKKLDNRALSKYFKDNSLITSKNRQKT